MAKRTALTPASRQLGTEAPHFGGCVGCQQTVFPPVWPRHAALMRNSSHFLAGLSSHVLVKHGLDTA
jgi:hypothetical protein